MVRVKRKVSQIIALIFFFSQLKADFFQLLKETPEVDSRSRLSDVKKKIESDPRYKAVDGDPRREDWFREYTRHLGDVRMTGIFLGTYLS